MSISRKAVFKRANYKAWRDSEKNKERAALADALSQFIRTSEGARPLYQAAAISSHVYAESGRWQRWQCIDKIWVPLCIVCSRAMTQQRALASELPHAQAPVSGGLHMDLNIIKDVAVRLCDLNSEALKTIENGDENGNNK